MKKHILLGALALSTFGVMFANPTSANAATWHKGVPSILKSGVWKVAGVKEYWAFNNKGVYDIDGKYVYETNKPMYAKSGNKYTIKSNYSKTKNLKYVYCTLTKINKNKFKFVMPHTSKDKVVYYTTLTRTYKIK